MERKSLRTKPNNRWAFFIVIDMEFQTRENDGTLRLFGDPKNAFDYAKDNPSVWKISFGIGADRVRLVREHDDKWSYEPMEDVLSSIILKESSKPKVTGE